MIIADLTHPIIPHMPVYPGTPAPDIRPAALLHQHGWRETSLTLWSHMGTHMDAPAHLLQEGQTLDTISPSQFFGPAVVLPCATHFCIPRSVIQETAGIRDADFLLFRTGWENHWSSPAYLHPWPHLSLEAAQWLATQHYKGIGIDTLSPDDAHSEELPIHRILLQAGILLLENLCGLEQLPTVPVQLTALPLLYDHADGASARIVAQWDETI